MGTVGVVIVDVIAENLWSPLAPEDFQ